MTARWRYRQSQPVGAQRALRPEARRAFAHLGQHGLRPERRPASIGSGRTVDAVGLPVEVVALRPRQERLAVTVEGGEARVVGPRSSGPVLSGPSASASPSGASTAASRGPSLQGAVDRLSSQAPRGRQHPVLRDDAPALRHESHEALAGRRRPGHDPGRGVDDDRGLRVAAYEDVAVTQAHPRWPARRRAPGPATGRTRGTTPAPRRPPG